MKKIIRLTESDLTRLVRRIVKENYENSLYSDIMGLIRNSNSSHEETIDVLNSIVDEMSSSRRLRRDVEKRFRDDMNENEDEEDEEDDGGYYTFDFGGPKDSTALISDIVELIENSEDVNDFKMKIKKYTKNNQEDFNKLSDDERDDIDRFINSIITRHDFN